MVKSLLFVAFFGILYSILLTVPTSQAVVELGQVKCQLFVNFSRAFFDAYSQCWIKMEKELREEDKKEAKGIPFPRNVSIEEFEWDDKCMEHCVYKTTGILTPEDTLPDTKVTEQLFSQGKVSKELYNSIVNGWNTCLELSGKIAKEKKFDICKTVTHHRFCFSKKMMETLEKTEVTC